jgi:hypothetical protein
MPGPARAARPAGGDLLYRTLLPPGGENLPELALHSFRTPVFIGSKTILNEWVRAEDQRSWNVRGRREDYRGP